MNPARRSDVHNVLDSPAKRSKGNDGRGRQSGWLPANTPTTSPAERTTVRDTIIADSNRKQPSTSENRRSTPTRTPTYFDLIHDALAAHPEGLCSNDVFEWLRKHRPLVFRQYDEKKLRTSVQGTLSAQSNRQQATVWKYKVDDSDGPGYIWKLASAVPSEEIVTARREPQVFTATDYSRTGAADFVEDARAPPLPAHSPRRAQAASPASATVQEQNDKSDGNDQTLETGDATVHGVNTQRVVSDTDRLTEDAPHQLSRTYSERSATTRPKSPTLLQPHMHTQDNMEPGAGTRNSDSTAPDAEGAQRHGDVSDDLCDSDHESQLRYGKLVSKLRRMRDRREQQTQKVDADRKALPDMNILEKSVEQTAAKVTELTCLLKESQKSAASALGDLEATTNKIKEIETAEREVEQLVMKYKEIRSQLGID